MPATTCELPSICRDWSVIACPVEDQVITCVPETVVPFWTSEKETAGAFG